VNRIPTLLIEFLTLKNLPPIAHILSSIPLIDQLRKYQLGKVTFKLLDGLNYLISEAI